VSQRIEHADVLLHAAQAITGQTINGDGGPRFH